MKTGNAGEGAAGAVAVIVAAGRGSRMNADVNKQYMDISGRQVLARTLEAFEYCGDVDSIVLVADSRDIIYCKREIIETNGFGKVRAIVGGGPSRQQSVYNGLMEVGARCGIVAIHDGARPFVRSETISASIGAAREFGAAAVAVPVKDTIKIAGPGGFVEQTLDRGRLWAMQTPQTFRYDIIMRAHRQAQEDNYTGTDDAVLVERLGIMLRLVMGSYDNIKITTKEDILAAQAIASRYDSTE